MHVAARTPRTRRARRARLSRARERAATRLMRLWSRSRRARRRGRASRARRNRSESARCAKSRTSSPIASLFARATRSKFGNEVKNARAIVSRVELASRSLVVAKPSLNPTNRAIHRAPVASASRPSRARASRRDQKRAFLRSRARAAVASAPVRGSRSSSTELRNSNELKRWKVTPSQLRFDGW